MRSAQRLCRISFDESSFLVNETTKASKRAQVGSQSSAAQVSSGNHSMSTMDTPTLITDETNSSLRKKSGGLKKGGKRAARLLFQTPIDENIVPEVSHQPGSSRFSLKDFDPTEFHSLHEKDIVTDAHEQLVKEQEENAARRKRIALKQMDVQSKEQWRHIGVKTKDDASHKRDTERGANAPLSTASSSLENPSYDHENPSGVSEKFNESEDNILSSPCGHPSSSSSSRPPPPPRSERPKEPYAPDYIPPSTTRRASISENKDSTLRGAEELSPQAAIKRAEALKAVTSSISSAMLLAQIRPDLPGVAAAAVVHRLGRYCRPQERQQLLQDVRFTKLLGLVETALPELNAQALCGTLWGLVRLRHQPEWMLTLLDHLMDRASTMSPHQISTALYCLSNNPVADTSEGQNLVDKLVANLRMNCEELNGGMDVVCTMTALSRLKVQERQIIITCVRKCIALLEENRLSIPEACQATSALAALRVTDRRFLEAVKRFFQHCNQLKVVDVGHLCNALVKMEGQVDIFDAFKPALRKTETIGSKDVASILNALSMAKVRDEDVLSHVCKNLVADIPQLKSYDVAKIVVALSRLFSQEAEERVSSSTEDNGGFSFIKQKNAIIAALVETTLRCASEMSPHQVSQCIYGFARLKEKSPKLWNELGAQLEAQALFLYPENAALILEAGGTLPLTRAQMRPVLDLLLHKPGTFVGEESLRVLKAAPHLPMMLRLDEAVIAQHATNLRERVRAFSNRIQGPFLVDTLCYLPQLRHQSPRTDLRPLLDALLQPLVPVIKRLAKDVPGSLTDVNQLFLAIVADEDFRRRVRRQVTSTRPSFAHTIEPLMGSVEAHLGTSVSLEVAQLCANVIQCGIDCAALRSILTREVADEDSAALMLFCLTELRMPVNVRLVERFAKAPRGAALLAWVACVNDRADLLDVIEPQDPEHELSGMRHDLILAQVALEAKMANNTKWCEWAQNHPTLSQKFADRLYVPHFAASGGGGKLREDGAEKRLSQALMSTRVPHRPDALVCHGTYKVGAVLPQKNLVLDMWSHKTDTLTRSRLPANPNNAAHVNGGYDSCDFTDGLHLAQSALLRRRHLEKCHGYEVISFTADRVHGNASDPDAFLDSLLAPHGGVEGARSLS